MIENPIKRRPTRKIRVGSVYVGGDAPISAKYDKYRNLRC